MESNVSNVHAQLAGSSIAYNAQDGAVCHRPKDICQAPMFTWSV